MRSYVAFASSTGPNQCVQRLVSCLQFAYLPDITFRDDSIRCTIPIGAIATPFLQYQTLEASLIDVTCVHTKPATIGDPRDARMLISCPNQATMVAFKNCHILNGCATCRSTSCSAVVFVKAVTFTIVTKLTYRTFAKIASTAFLRENTIDARNSSNMPRASQVASRKSNPQVRCVVMAY
jgi:hypothetical protein